MVFTKKHHSGLLCTFHCVILITHFKIMNKNNIENTYRKKPGFLAIGNTRQKISWQRKVGSFSFYNLFVYFFSLWRNKCYILIDLLLTMISLLIYQLSISDQFYCVSMFVCYLYFGTILYQDHADLALSSSLSIFCLSVFVILNKKNCQFGWYDMV